MPGQAPNPDPPPLSWGLAAPFVAALLTCLAILMGCLAVGWATHWGSGRAGDGHAYVASARNVLQGNWVSFEDYDIAADPKPLEQFPPGYPLMLAAGASVTGCEWAAWLRC